MKKISRLHYITTNATLAQKACEAGVDWIQLRLKSVTYEEYRTTAEEVKKVCKNFNCQLIINDNVQLAFEMEADGVHVGKTDMAPEKARDLVGSKMIIGGTANTYADIVRLTNARVDYIGLGPFRFTTTKENLSPILGLEGYKSIFQQIAKDNLPAPPIIAIGGIGLEDIATLLEIGVYGVAISGAISNAEDVTKAAASFINAINKSYQLQSI